MIDGLRAHRPPLLSTYPEEAVIQEAVCGFLGRITDRDGLILQAADAMKPFDGADETNTYE